MQAVKVLLVDDSLFMRNALKKLFAVPDIEIIGTANNGKEAVEKNLELNPDLILLDIEMPVMNGLEALKRIMETNPTPVLMFSTLTQDGAKETVEAMALGALDFVPKQGAYFDVSSAKEELIKKIINLGSNKFLRANLKAKYSCIAKPEQPATSVELPVIKTKVAFPNYVTSRRRPSPSDIKIVCIGISTGGSHCITRSNSAYSC